MTAREYLDSIKKNMNGIESLTREISRTACNGLAPDEHLVLQLNDMATNMRTSRAELSRLLGEVGGRDVDFQSLPLDTLEELVSKRELRDKMCVEKVVRIERAARMLGKLDLPKCGARSIGQLSTCARTMLTRGDMDGLSALEGEATPYIDLCALLRDAAGAMRADAGLIGRLAGFYPQIAWFLRAQASIAAGGDSFDDIDDKALDELRSARSDEAGMNGGELKVRGLLAKTGRAIRGDAKPDPRQKIASDCTKADERKGREDTAPDPRNAEPPKRQSTEQANAATLDVSPSPAQIMPGNDYETQRLRNMAFNADELDKTFNVSQRANKEDNAVLNEFERALRGLLTGENALTVDELAQNYPEFDGLRKLKALLGERAQGAKQRDMAGVLMRRAVLQAYIYDDIIISARKFLRRNTLREARPANIAQAVRVRLMGREGGEIADVLNIICARDIAKYARVQELYDRIMIPGSDCGVQLSRFEEYVTSIWRDEADKFADAPSKPTGAAVLDWLQQLNPALLIIGRWHSLMFPSVVGNRSEHTAKNNT